MKKLFVICMCLILALPLFACGENACQHTWNEGEITKEASRAADGERTYTCSLCSTTKTEAVKFVAPTAKEVYLARQATIESNIEGYDFEFSLSGNFGEISSGGLIDGKYSGQYRYNKTTGAESFKRTTSGLLFYDSTIYTYTKNNQKIKIDVDYDTNKVKKSSVLRVQNENNFFINKAVSALVDMVKESTVSNIEINPLTEKRDFSANLNFGANNEKIAGLTGAFSNMGTSVAFKEVSVTNPTALPFKFSIDKSGQLSDFALEFSVGFKQFGVTISYQQTPANTDITIPSDASIITSDAGIQSEITKINNSLLAVKADDAYSLDVEAVNEFDPAWNKLAISDKYIARMYKNTVDENVYYNHSYEYKAHHETDGAESYKYTLGNIKEGTSHLISRRGTNTVTQLDNVSCETQFNYLVSPFIFDSNKVDCISKEENGANKKYLIHVSDACAIELQDKIIDIINSNDGEGVVDVNNYLPEIVNIIDAMYEVVYENNALTGISIIVDLRYAPSGGEYTDYNITLTNEFNLLINKNLSKAQDYESPSSADGSILGLKAAKYYIL